jgi:hypothetical protein
MSHHPTYTPSARRWFAAATTPHGGYNAIAARLEAAGLPRPSQGTPAYRDAVLAALEAGRAPETDADVLAAADPESALKDLAWQMGALR